MDESPRSVADVEALIHRMYSSKDSQEINSIQERIQILQRSNEGWQLADALLASSDATSRFFGALTFTVKLNIDGPMLAEADAQVILQKLISWLVKLASRDDAKSVLSKLTSTLVVYFVRSSTLLRRPLLHLGHALSTGIVTSDSQSSQDASLDLANCTEQQLAVLLEFAEDLANELDRFGYNSPAQARLHNELEQDVQFVKYLIDTVLKGQSKTISLQERALKAYQAWALYAQSNLAGKHEASEVLVSLTDSVLQCFVNEATEIHALPAFTLLLETNTNFFKQYQFDAITSIIQNHITPRMTTALEDNGSDLDVYTQFLVAFGNAIIQDIVEKPQDARSQVLLGLFSAILSTNGVPGDTDDITLLTIDFWCTYSEHVTDTVGSHTGSIDQIVWLPQARSVMMHTCRLLWKKMHLPDAKTVKEWDDEEMAAFRSFRSDAEELFNFIHVTLEHQLTTEIVQIALDAISQRQWIATEAAVAILAALADSILEHPAEDASLLRLFQSSLLRDVADFNMQMPSRVRKTVIDLVGEYGTFITRNTQFIPDAVRFLFASLEVPSLANASARAIFDLCSTCRTHLIADLDGFMAQYSSVIAMPHVDSYIKEKVIGGIASIVQAVSSNDLKIQPLLILLDNIDRDILAARELLSTGSRDHGIAVGLSALLCLASMGNALQAPEDVPIDLSDDDSQSHAIEHAYWTSGDGKVVQDRIVSCFSVLDMIGSSGEAIDAACRVLRAGYKEQQPGPFVLPPAVTTSFLESCSINTPQVEAVLSAAASFITQHSQSLAPRIDDSVAVVLRCSLTFMHNLGHPSRDPGVAEGCIDIAARSIPTYASILLSTPDLDSVLKFALQAVEGQDLLPKRAALELWNKLVKAASEVQSMSSLSEDARHKAGAVMAAAGQPLTQVLVRQVAGIGRRSDLDHVNETIKALFNCLPAQVKGWFEEALFGSSFPPVTGKVGEAEKRRFLTQLVGLRGSPKTKDVIKTFYAACRGTVSSYS